MKGMLVAIWYLISWLVNSKLLFISSTGGHTFKPAASSHSTKEEVELKENLCYGPVATPPAPPPAATQTVAEYEEIIPSS